MVNNHCSHLHSSALVPESANPGHELAGICKFENGDKMVRFFLRQFQHDEIDKYQSNYYQRTPTNLQTYSSIITGLFIFSLYSQQLHNRTHKKINSTQFQFPEMQQQQAQIDDALICPSFNSYSGNGLAAIAAKVTDEFRNIEILEEDIDDDFEFSIVFDDIGDVTADELIYNGQIRPIFPIFNHDLIKNDGDDREIRGGEEVSTIRIPLKTLFGGEDRDERRSSTSSSEAEDLEPIPAGSYCVWRPKDVESSSSSPSRWNWKKSPSTGSGSGSRSGSKRWNLRDLLLRRSNSDGKGPFVFLTPKNKGDKTEGSKNVLHDSPKPRRNSVDGVRKVKAAGASPSPSPSRSSPHEMFYVRNRAEKEEGKRKSYLPYRRNLVGFFASVHGIGQPF